MKLYALGTKKNTEWQLLAMYQETPYEFFRNIAVETNATGLHKNQT